MLSLADTTLPGAVVASGAGTGVEPDVVPADEETGVDVALPPQATNIMVKRITNPAIEGRQRRFDLINSVITSTSP